MHRTQQPPSSHHFLLLSRSHPTSTKTGRTTMPHHLSHSLNHDISPCHHLQTTVQSPSLPRSTLAHHHHLLASLHSKQPLSAMIVVATAYAVEQATAPVLPMLVPPRHKPFLPPKSCLRSPQPFRRRRRHWSSQPLSTTLVVTIRHCRRQHHLPCLPLSPKQKQNLPCHVCATNPNRLVGLLSIPPVSELALLVLVNHQNTPASS